MNDAPQIARQALALVEAGDDAGAAALFERGLQQFPGDARFANSAGNFHAKAGRTERALELFTRALAVMPSLGEAAVNAAIVLMRLDRPREAARLLAKHEGAASARYWSVRGDAERLSGDLAAAARSYERSTAMEPHYAKALAGRARVALERSEADVVAAYDSAFAANPGDPEVFRDLIQALAATGRLGEALECSSALIGQLPGWTEALVLHAELRWASGDRAAFSDHFAASAERAKGAELHLAWASVLSGVDQFDAAATVLERAEREWPDHRGLALARAIALGEAGRMDEAHAVLDRFPVEADPDWDLARGRIALQHGDVDRAEALLAAVRSRRPDDVAAWALTDLCWRVKGDARHEWLHGDPVLVRQISLPLDERDFAAVRELLSELHRSSAMPIGQSVKHGSQTKGALLARLEPEIGLLRRALEQVVADYRTALPPADPSHPLLKHRDAPWAITGSWSIRLDGTGHHAAHIHPKGLLSSACYLVVPDEVTRPDRPGWLELGHPPAHLAGDLGPLHAIEPKPGTCVLFPSTLFHGTRPISHGIRMTTAFDVTVANAG